MTLKAWPADGDIVRFTALTDPLATWLRARVRNFESCAEPGYDGLDIGHERVPSPDEGLAFLLTAEGQAYHQDQDRDVYDIVIAYAVLLGVEQGRRLERKRIAELAGIEAVKAALGVTP